MSSDRFLITGAFGCIGAWAVKRLLDEGADVTTYDLPGNPHRLKLLLSDAELAKVRIVAGDITDAAGFEQAVVDNDVSHVIHLAALQVPLVRANPVLGAKVNVEGTAVVFETVRQHAAQIRGLAYASSIAVYGPASMYPPGPIAHDAPFAPATLYGVTKVANEEWARLYWQDYHVPSVGLRPFFVYGPGRDQGVSSYPSKSMVAAAVGRPYHVPFGAGAVYQHAEDVAAAMIKASRTMPEGAPVYNLGGTVATVPEIIAAIEEVVPEAKGTITFDPAPLFTPDDVDGAPVEQLLGPIRWRPLVNGVRDTVAHTRRAVQAGRIDIDRAIA